MLCKNCRRNTESTWKFCPYCASDIASHPSIDEPQNSHADKRAAREKSAHPSGFGTTVREQVFEVIVRQAISGAPWREICQGPMLVNQITEAEIEKAVKRRLDGDDGWQTAPVPKNPHPPDGSGAIALSESKPSQQLTELRTVKADIASGDDTEYKQLAVQLTEVVQKLDALVVQLRNLELNSENLDANSLLQADLERELQRNRISFKPDDDKGPHHIT